MTIRTAGRFHQHKYKPAQSGDETCMRSLHKCGCGKEYWKKKRRPFGVLDTQCMWQVTFCAAHPDVPKPQPNGFTRPLGGKKVMMGLIGVTLMIDRLINESDTDTGDIALEEAVRLREVYEAHDMATRARIRGFLERRLRENLMRNKMRNVRAVTNLMRAVTNR